MSTAEDLAQRLFSSTVAAFDLAGVYLGHKLGYYESLAGAGPATADELASRTGTDARYAREWLEQQAVGGILDVDADHRFTLPATHAEVLVGPESLSFMAPVSRQIVAAFGQLPRVADAFRTGDGVGWESYGPDMREGQAAFNRPAVTRLLGQEWLPAVADIDARLRAQPPARIVDVACGEGWSTLALARAYPEAEVVGIDLDGPSIEAARKHAAESGMADAVTFVHGDAAALEGRFDLALIIEAVHDMSNPVPVLSAIRESLTTDGSLVVVDEGVAETFTAPGDDLERFMYGWSLTVCLPDGRSRQPSVATGTVMRPGTLRRYATEAGFGSVEILPIENDFFRFYRLRP
jgi:SAM-dependent methyltransferase